MPAVIARIAAPTCAAAAALLLCAMPVEAQWATPPIKVAAPGVNDAYTGPVEPLPSDCNFSEVSIPNGIPRVRPVLQKPGSSALIATSAQVVPGVPLPAGWRQVAYSYTFTRLGLRIPPFYAGSFRVTSVRTTVYKGPTTADPVASDRILTGTDSAAGVGSVTQSWGNGPVAGFSNTWLVRNISTGWWTNAFGAPEAMATVGMQCTMAVKAAAPPLVLQ